MTNSGMLLADIDPIQIAIIVIAMAAGFFQWLWKVIQQGQEERQRGNAPDDTEEKRLRDEVWRRQVQQPQAQPQRRPSPTVTPPPLNDPWSSVRDVFEKMKEEMRKAQEEAARPTQRPASAPNRPSAPPHLPQPQRPVPGTVRADLQRQPYFQPPVAAPRTPAAEPPPPPRPPSPATPPVHFPEAAPQPKPHTVRAPVKGRPAIAGRAPVAARAAVQPRSSRSDSSGLRALLANPASLKQAILLHEVLGPPKSLQSSTDSAN